MSAGRLVVGLLTVCAALRRDTLRDLDGNNVQRTLFFRRLEAAVEEEYAKNRLQFDAEDSPEVEEDPEHSITVLNRQYSDLLFEGDIRVTRSLMRNVFSSRRTRQALLRNSTNTWRYVPYAFHPAMPYDKRRKILAGINFWRTNTCIDFRPRTTERNYLYFIGHDVGCWSTVGRDETQFQQKLSIGKGCDSMGIITHEIAHALGMYHQQSRSDRDDYVRVIPNRIRKSILHNFWKRSDSEATSYELPYDLGSVMHYSSVEFAIDRNQASLFSHDTNMQTTMGNRDEPTFLDLLIMNHHYKCFDRCPSFHCSNGGFVDPRDCSQCKCPPGFMGRYCHLLNRGNTKGCGGILNAEAYDKNFIGSLPELTESDTNARECIFHLQAPPGKRVVISLSNVMARCVHGCNYERAEFRIDSDRRKTGYRFCCDWHAPRQFVSKTSLVPVIIKANSNSTMVEFSYRIA